MIGLRPHARDLGPVAEAGDATLLPPGEDELLGLVRERMWVGSGPSPRALELVYARWKPAVSLVTAYAVDFDDDERRILIQKRYAQPKDFRPEARQRDAVDRLRPSLSLVDRSCELRVFPVDRALPGAVRALDPKRMARHLESAAVVPPPGISARRSVVEVLRYKPERRLVARYTALLRQSGKRRVDLALRALPPATLPAHAAARRVIEPLGLAPRLLHTEERTGLLVEEWVSGEPCARDAFAIFPDLAPQLVALHARPGSGPSPAAPVAADATEAPLLAWCSELAARMRDLPRPTPLRPRVWLHGDLHPDQVVRGEGGALRLLDWDGLRAGEPVEDLASWAADAIEARAGVAEPGSVLGEVLREYERAGGGSIDPDRAASITAWSLVARAAGSVRRLERGARAKAADLLDLALALSGGRR